MSIIREQCAASLDGFKLLSLLMGLLAFRRELTLLVILDADAADQLQLRFEKVDVFLFTFQDFLEQIPRNVVARMFCRFHGGF